MYRCKKRYQRGQQGRVKKQTIQFHTGTLALTQETTRHAELGRIRQRRHGSRGKER
ncbi:hypothetical protein EMIT0P12_80186 [Pseudomonas sp. IT-P12]